MPPTKEIFVMTDLSTIQTAVAKYTPSVPPIYAETVMKDPSSVRGENMPAAVTLDDLNFLNPNCKLFHINHVLYSAGQAMGNKNPCMIKSRNRSHTTVNQGDKITFATLEILRGK